MIAALERNANTSLRHGRAHRAKLKAIAAECETVVVATREVCFMDGVHGARDAIDDLKRWAKSRGREVELLRSESRHDHCRGGLHLVWVFGIKGPVTLPTTIDRWKIAKAAPEQEAWARKKARQ